MENFITITGQSTYIGGSSYVLSSYAVGKAPAIPYKRYNKASSSRKRKRLKITTTAIEVEAEPFTYYKPKSKPK
jgi:hypothetical protein